MDVDSNKLFTDEDFEDSEAETELATILHPEKYAQGNRRRAILEHFNGPREVQDF